MTDKTPDQRLDILDASETDALRGGASFSLAHRMRRAVWGVTWLLLASWTPPPLHPWRRLLLKAFGARMGRRARVYGSARIWYPPNLEMGDYAVMGWDVVCYNQDKVVLEDYAIVSQYSHLVAGTHDIDSPTFQLYTKPIRICRYAWIASNAFVGPGVTAHEGSVLGGCGATFKDLEPWTVYGGNPAKPLRKRRNFLETT
ncbi:putative colanic acid biosynthesis acetyltransferase [Chthonobacter albigriseus]|uniref:putative colanic acid biosynthesis acetyltransferase n=1 Tax=Chthonobacter albigriseus TaxID=1683161 RepID=UPI0015EEF97A|nr:putative colanic acid biosynthesis acetyltransferase [Chthonobacter albigriseus]